MNIAIRNDMHVLVEVKSSISESDVDGFWSIGRLYESSDVRHRLVIISPTLMIGLRSLPGSWVLRFILASPRCKLVDTCLAWLLVLFPWLFLHELLWC
ncbi:MAG: hypothetical protein ACP5L5_07345 [Vulcanisaeta sp.]|uniref:hypothetical protein n=1 Tax=Vulcanisaeta sp. TaxID=2020871 RepID=UPI003D124DB5